MEGGKHGRKKMVMAPQSQPIELFKKLPSLLDLKVA